ncbi:protein ILRUN-like [Neoarius graeffei]|uniref:protein ILRUN-like n=1 Tax=Neoarius graeffei TaxID=443677 RepID=UPI00298C89FE|nr:protein ILRUN-like [Neoarius graeffei]
MEAMETEIDSELMWKFSCMGTTDKDTLITEFQRLLGSKLSPAECAFFLDMTNWNLQAAIGAFYDFESPSHSALSMSFVKDVTIGEGESIPPDTPFIKTWRIQNTGSESWPPGVSLRYTGGDQFGHVNFVMVRSLEPQETDDVSVQMHSPRDPGMYQGQWRMCTATGLFYGDVIWVILSVEVGGLLGVTQQLSSFQTEFNTQPRRSMQGEYNPFASPHNATQSDSLPKDSAQTQHAALSNGSVTIATSDPQNGVSATHDQPYGPHPFGQ